MFKHRASSLVALSFFCAVPAAAGLVSVTVDTSSIAGTMGSLDFNFNPGPFVTQTASAQILNFSSDGTGTGSPFMLGDVSGILPAAVTFDNGMAFNDYFQGFTFGSTLAFDINLFGPALSSPDGISTSGSTFAFSMFSDAAGTLPALTTDQVNGFAVLVNVNLDGTTTTISFLPGGAAVPEPGGLGLVGAMVAAFLGVSRQRRRASRGLPAPGARRTM